MSRDIVLADGHALTRAGLRNILEAEPGVRIVGETESGREAVALVKRHKPQVVILDIRMPELNGLDASEIILREYPETKILILSMYADPGYVDHAFRIGAKGYLLKDCATDEVVTALEVILKGSRYLSPGISEVTIPGFQRGDTPGEWIESPP